MKLSSNDNDNQLQISHKSEDWMYNFLKYTLVYYDQLFMILNSNLDYYQKKEQINNLFAPINKGHYFDNLLNLTDAYLNGNIKDDDFFKQVDTIRAKNINDAKSRLASYFSLLHKNDDISNTYQGLQDSLDINSPEFQNFFNDFNSLNSASLEELVVDLNNPFSASLSEQSISDLQLNRKTGDNVKKQYKYKVEGTISSGIGELDEFLGIIQPGLNLLLIGVARIFYEGVVDNIEKLGAYYEYWAKSQSNIKKAYDFLHFSNALDEDDKFHYRVRLENDENHIATAFNNLVIEKINLNRKKSLDILINDIKNKCIENSSLSQEKLSNIQNHPDIIHSQAFKTLSPEDQQYYNSQFQQLSTPISGNAFNKLKDLSETQTAIQSIIKDVLRQSRDKDDKGNPIPKATDKGKASLNSIMYLIDLFNKDNDPSFYNKFVNIINYYKDGYTSTSFGSFIEDDANDYLVIQQQEAAKKGAMQDFINALGGEEAFRERFGGNSKS